MVTKEAFQDPHKETVGWENFLGMTIGQAVVWASQNIDPKETNPELTTSEPYVMGSHATCSGAWASGPEDYAPSEYQWGYNRMMTVEGLFGAGDTIGGTAHKFSSGSFTEGRIAGKAAVKYVNDMGNEQPQVSEAEYEDLKKTIYKPLETYEVGRNEIVAGTVSPSYLLPLHGLQRLEKIMDEYVGGISAHYTTNEPLLTRGIELLTMLKEDLAYLGAEDLHQLQRAWELQHRVLASEAVTQHTLFRTETRWPGYYYRADHPKLDDKDWHCFTLSRYDRESGTWADGEGSGVSHHRLIARALGTSRLTDPAFSGFVFMSAGPAIRCDPQRSSDPRRFDSRRNRNAATRTAARFGVSQATAPARDGAGRGTQAGGETQEDSSRFACRLRRVHAGDGSLYAARWVHGARRLARFVPGHETDQRRLLADPDHASRRQGSCR